MQGPARDIQVHRGQLMNGMHVCMEIIKTPAGEPNNRLSQAQPQVLKMQMTPMIHKFQYGNS